MEVKLLERVRQAIRIRHYSRRTEQAYIAWIRRFIVFHGKRHPRELGEREVTAFVSHLAERSVSASTQNQAWLMASLMYGAGLRLLECAELRVKHITSIGVSSRFETGKAARIA
jgi:site-specific recombinase XerD